MIAARPSDIGRRVWLQIGAVVRPGRLLALHPHVASVQFDGETNPKFVVYKLLSFTDPNAETV